MDFPYLFTSILNWNIGEKEIGRRASWDIFLNNRNLDMPLYGVQGTRQDYYHIEPNIYHDRELGIRLNKYIDSIMYYAYYRNSINFLACNLFFTKQCYHEYQKELNKAFTVIPVFEDEKEHNEFLSYAKNHAEKFRKAVETQSVNEMCPPYAQKVNNVIVYKLGKTLVQWLDEWRVQ